MPARSMTFPIRNGSNSAYRLEIAHFVQRLTGAAHVLTYNMVVRQNTGGGTSAERAEGVHAPVGDVHLDYTPGFANSMARRKLDEAGIAGFPFSRFVAINVWRATSSPPQDWPLALCDGASVADIEGIPLPVIEVEALPDAETAVTMAVAEDPNRHCGFEFKHSAAHRWYYFPNMEPDELILFKNYDSLQHGAWRVPHASFAIPDAEHANPRESVEVRTIAYFR